MKPKNKLRHTLVLAIFLFSSVVSAAVPIPQNKLIQELDKTELEVGRLQEKVEGFTGSIRSASSTINSLELDLLFKNSTLLSRKKLINERLKNITLYSVPQRMEFLSAMDDLDSINRSEAVLSYMLKKDIAEYNAVSSEVEKLNELKDIVGKEKNKLEENKQKVSEYLEELKKAADKKRKLLSKMESTDRGYKALVNRSQKSGQKISSIVGSAKKIAVYTESTASDLFNGLVKPVQGRITSRFGKFWDTRIKNWVYNKGVSVNATYGAEVRSVSSGSVSFAGWMPSYGRVLIIKHGSDMFSVYGHLARTLFLQGDKVNKGSVIAYVGDTGSVQKPTLYFELSRAKNSVDPSPLFEQGGT
ncbi:MAG: peptidoglycan DD-metalloendopeptidase family protein [Pseudomonadota bacterium]